MASSTHEASSSALGYLFQAQLALLELLRGAEERPDGAISLELHDDVAWEADGRPVDLLQVKHHIRGVRTLGDKDDDVWRTVQSWMDTHDPGDADGPWLTLMTTQQARPGSAMAALRLEGRDPVAALDLLTAAAKESEAKGTKGARERFLELPVPERAVFVRRMRVVDSSPTIDDVDGAVRTRLRAGLPQGHEDPFMRQLWAWWHEQTVEMLQKRRTSVSVDRLMASVSRIRDDYTAGRLPTLVDRGDFPAEAEEELADACFVHQLQWVGAARQLNKAMVDYYRAYQQTVEWLEDDLVGIDELAQFEGNLSDEWGREFDWMLDDLGEDATDAERERAGRELLRKTLDQTRYQIRERYDEAFFARGKHHELADRGRIGWHPDFEERVTALTRAARA
ncbi:ABC-three component system protein [Kitasatospora sp. NPDC088346]|uniref:ABC-three component system protein n=1 Tax=Kitasatospora sp. NPDC088346 TaxID=3364073 RepID=UPI0038042C2D